MKTIAAWLLLCASVLGQPPDDRAKWHLTVFTADGCGACQELKADFDSPVLAPWKAISHLNFINIDQASQQARRTAFSVSPDGKVPVLVFYPPKNHPRYPYVIVYRQAGYDGDEKELAHNLYHAAYLFQNSANRVPKEKLIGGNYVDAVKREMQSAKEWGCPLCPRKRFRPRPEPEPEEEEWPDLPLPNIPDVIPNKPEPEEAPSDIPNYPLVTVIYDPMGLGEESRVDGLKKIAYNIILPFEFNSPKGQLLPVGSERAKAFPVKHGDAPAIFVTDKGKILAAVNRQAISILLSNKPKIEPKEDPPKEPPTEEPPEDPVQEPPKVEEPEFDIQDIINQVLEKVSVDEDSILSGVVDRLKNSPEILDLLKGKDGADGKDCNPEEIKKVLLTELTAIINQKMDPVKEKRRHVVVVADQGADYWPRLSSEISRARESYSSIKVAPPPEFAAQLPQLVVYEEGVPVRRVSGLYNVSNDLAHISRGTFPPSDRAD